MAVRLDIDEVIPLSTLADAISALGDNAESVINRVLHDEAGPLIYKKINPLIHPSGRTFKGHTASARSSDWPSYLTNRNLSVTVTTKSKFAYLYFPDDGSNSHRHYGNQQFFARGGEDAAQEIADRCVKALLEELE